MPLPPHPQPKYESFFIINPTHRQYQPQSTNALYSKCLSYSARGNNRELSQGKRLPVTSRCHRLLPYGSSREKDVQRGKNKENAVGVREEFMGRRLGMVGEGGYGNGNKNSNSSYNKNRNEDDTQQYRINNKTNYNHSPLQPSSQHQIDTLQLPTQSTHIIQQVPLTTSYYERESSSYRGGSSNINKDIIRNNNTIITITNDIHNFYSTNVNTNNNTQRGIDNNYQSSYDNPNSKQRLLQPSMIDSIIHKIPLSLQQQPQQQQQHQVTTSHINTSEYYQSHYHHSHHHQQFQSSGMSYKYQGDNRQYENEQQNNQNNAMTSSVASSSRHSKRSGGLSNHARRFKERFSAEVGGGDVGGVGRRVGQEQGNEGFLNRDLDIDYINKSSKPISPTVQPHAHRLLASRRNDSAKEQQIKQKQQYKQQKQHQAVQSYSVSKGIVKRSQMVVPSQEFISVGRRIRDQDNNDTIPTFINNDDNTTDPTTVTTHHLTTISSLSTILTLNPKPCQSFILPTTIPHSPHYHSSQQPPLPSAFINQQNINMQQSTTTPPLPITTSSLEAYYYEQQMRRRNEARVILEELREREGVK